MEDYPEIYPEITPLDMVFVEWSLATPKVDTSAQNQFFELLFEKDEVTWQTILIDLVKSEKMDPWDINMQVLAQRFIEFVQQMKQADLRIPGKIILAAAILLRIKSNKLLDEDLSNLDRLFAASEGEEVEGLLNELMEDSYNYDRDALKEGKLSLIPRTPQPRKRKVSIYDLVEALQRAIEVKKRRVFRDIPPLAYVPNLKKIDIGKLINDVGKKIEDFFSGSSSAKLTFTQLIPSESKQDKVYTFIPLLHLTNQRKIDMYQEVNFGEIEIKLHQIAHKEELEKMLS